MTTPHDEGIAAVKRDAMLITTKNESYGFFGTVSGKPGYDPNAEWSKAFYFILTNAPKVDGVRVTPDEVRGYLDSKAGRHIADQVVCGKPIETLAGLFRGRGWWFGETIAAFRKESW